MCTKMLLVYEYNIHSQRKQKIRGKKKVYNRRKSEEHFIMFYE